jgi:esterase/lipase superfamily enzyme
MEMLVFGHAGAKVLVFPTRGGRFYEYEHMRMPDVLRDKIENGHIQLYCIDSIDSESLYCWWAHPSGRVNRHNQYERYILDEVFPFMHDRNDHPCVISHGCSLGAYHAANIAFRHPYLFKKLAAFSGRYDLTMNVEYFGDLFDGFYNEDIYYHTPTHFLPSLECNHRLQALREMDIVLVIGEHDPFRENNEHLSSILHNKGVSHQLQIWGDRAHQGYYWRRMAPIYI